MRRTPTLTGEQRKEYEREHWTPTILGDLIERRCGVRYQSKTSERLLFRQARFTYHKPGRVYHRRAEQEVDQWRKKAKKRLEASLISTKRPMTSSGI